MIRALAVSVGIGLGIAACGGGAPAPSNPEAPATAAADDAACPVAVPGTSVTVEDTDLGASLVFVTTGDAAAVRTRAQAMARAHTDHHAAMGPLPTGLADPDGEGGHHHHHEANDGASGHAGHGGGHGAMAGMIGVHSGATSVDIDGGARIDFVAAPGDVPALRDELRMHAQHLAAGTCAMEH